MNPKGNENSGGDGNGDKNHRSFMTLATALGAVVSFVVIASLLFASKARVAELGADQAATKSEHTRQFIEIQEDIREIKADIKTLLVASGVAKVDMP